MTKPEPRTSPSEMRQAWERFRAEIEAKYKASNVATNIKLYDYLLTSIIPDEIRYWQDEESDELLNLPDKD
jgi:hypothetical protein